VLRAGRITPQTVQKYINKWIPAAYDLFGVDHSSSAHWFYVWGLKGRYDEHQNADPANKEQLNEHSRYLYRLECEQLIAQMNKLIADPEQKLMVPDLKFNRRIGEYANQPFSVTGERLSPEEYKRHGQQVLPTEEDVAELSRIFQEGDWVELKNPSLQ
ncbi:MAG: hypothetical protein ACE5MH_01110, partial [Terriglobia bacterium]